MIPPYIARIFVLAAWILYCLSHGTGAETKYVGGDVTKLLDSMLDGYDARLRPNFGGEPAEINVTIDILSIPSFESAKMRFTVVFYFRQMWNDPRLSFKGAPEIIKLGPSFADKIWKPDTFFRNERMEAGFGEGMASPADTLLEIKESGDVKLATRLTKTLHCRMNFYYFPMDTQVCSLDLESFGFTTSDILYKWVNGTDSVGFSSDVNLPNFAVTMKKAQNSEFKSTTGENYSGLWVDFMMTRRYDYLVEQIYLPAAALALISWIAVWINPKATTARFLVGIIPAVTMILFASSVSAGADRSNITYNTPMDIYMRTCTIMVLVTLAELVLVEVLISKNKGQTSGTEMDKDRAGSRLKFGINRITPEIIDTCFKIGFLACFILFNVIYWISYRTIVYSVADMGKDGWALP